MTDDTFLEFCGVQVMNLESIQFSLTLYPSYSYISYSILSNHACPAKRGRQIPVQVVARCWNETILILAYTVCCLTHRTITFYLYCWCRQITHCFDPGHCSVSSGNNMFLRPNLCQCRGETRSSEIPVTVLQTLSDGDQIVPVFT